MGDNINMHLKEIGCNMGWIHLVQDDDQSWALTNTKEPSGSIKCLKFVD